MERSEVHLGDDVRDTITGFEGVVVAVTDWLNGCCRVTVQPRALHEGRPVEAAGFDIEQLETVARAETAKAKKAGGPRPNPTRHADPVR